MHRYLTKSRFKLARECPTKLFYTRKKDVFADSSLNDSFLEALAEGGFQVGELAKHYYSGGHEVSTLDAEEALAQTHALLQQDEVIIFEAAIRYENLFIRVDILQKRKDHLKIVEVKAKSYSSDMVFVSDRGKIKSDWRPYLEDVAFQKHVVMNAFPGSTISSYLMLVDKEATCPIDGLNHKFKVIKKEDRYKGIEVSNNLCPADLEPRILREIGTDDSTEILFQEIDAELNMGFKERIQYFSDQYSSDSKIATKIGRHCKQCQFVTSEKNDNRGLTSGFKSCWTEQTGWSDADFEEPNILEIWNLNYTKRDSLFESGVLKMKSVTEDDIGVKEDDQPGISSSERQWLQVEKVINGDSSIWLDAPGLRSEIKSWEYPLNFIDFETAMPAIPFNKGQHPYQGIAFQFSHHTVTSRGEVEHVGQYLNTIPGAFPSYDFVRALKSSLETNSGTIFRYSPHENTYLNLIMRQLKAEPDGVVNDREDLVAFILHITQARKGEARRLGERNMKDLWDVVKRFYYSPSTKGSNSIKAVLPAMLNSSDFLKQKYSHPIYGTEGGIKSLNFSHWSWVEFESDGVTVKDPYKRLPPLFPDLSPEQINALDLLSDNQELADGGAAMTAYAKLQFTDMSTLERAEIEESLLRYCELDTLAMVMIYEGWVAQLDLHG